MPPWDRLLFPRGPAACILGMGRGGGGRQARSPSSAFCRCASSGTVWGASWPSMPSATARGPRVTALAAAAGRGASAAPRCGPDGGEGQGMSSGAPLGSRASRGGAVLALVGAVTSSLPSVHNPAKSGGRLLSQVRKLKPEEGSFSIRSPESSPESHWVAETFAFSFIL